MIAGYAASKLLEDYLLPGISITFLMLGAAALLSVFISRKFQPVGVMFRIACWSNLITWLFPIVGVFTGTMALVAWRENESGKSYLKLLGYFGLIASIANALAGLWIRANP